LPFTKADDGIRLRLKVTPRARHNAIGPVHHDSDGCAVLKVSVIAVAEKGRANEAVTKLLAKVWGVPRTRIKLAADLTGRRKIVHFEGEPDAVMAGIEHRREKSLGRRSTD